jgi:hypothetical protein
MDWKQNLDKHLTTPPDDGFDAWAEDVIGHEISEGFYNENVSWIEESDGQCGKWLNTLFRAGKSPEEAAKIIERDYQLIKTEKSCQ